MSVKAQSKLSVRNVPSGVPALAGVTDQAGGENRSAGQQSRSNGNFREKLSPASRPLGCSPNVLRPYSQAKHSPRRALPSGNIHHHLQLPGRLCRAGIAEDRPQRLMQVDLHELHRARGTLPPLSAVVRCARARRSFTQ